MATHACGGHKTTTSPFPPLLSATLLAGREGVEESCRILIRNLFVRIYPTLLARSSPERLKTPSYLIHRQARSSSFAVSLTLNIALHRKPLGESAVFERWGAPAVSQAVGYLATLRKRHRVRDGKTYKAVEGGMH